LPDRKFQAHDMKRMLQYAAIRTVDGLMAGIPRELPQAEVVERCRLIAHRGVHDNRRVMENTLAAFELARAAGVWGVECDIRWTADLVPVVCHDHDARRVFGRSLRIDELTFARLRRELPLIPSLEEVIAEFGGNTHLMLEIKDHGPPRWDLWAAILRRHLTGLVPGRDYHVLALAPELFAAVNFLPPRYCFPVAQTNVSALSRTSLEQGYGGLTGHFLLLDERIKQRHELAGQRIGTGFVASRNCLLRELNRGVEWIFSNNAARLQGILDSLRR
jgi:glycerophosphoryl diester phosphodiesterase